MNTDALPKISVIVPAYNAAEYLREALDSVLAQDYPSLELIVVDDGSTDDTRAICASYGDRIRYEWQKNSGTCSVPRNRGFGMATGSLVVFFDADDLMSPGRLRRQAQFMRQCPEAPAAFTDYRNFDAKGPADRTHFSTCTEMLRALRLDEASTTGVPVDGALFRRLLLRENFTITGAAMYRAEAYRELGGFDDVLRASEDFDMNYRMARRGPCGVLPEVGFERRLHDKNMSWDSPRIIEFKIRSRTKLLESETSPELQRLLRNALSGLYRDAALMRARTGKGRWGSDLLTSVSMRPARLVDTAAAFLRCVKYSLRARAEP
jgi:glycosyltransferase involved in cell wall biosynthesis